MAADLVLVTGASSGIGEATARRYGASGARVLLLARNAERLDDVAHAIRKDGGAASPYPVDLADSGAIEEVSAQNRKRGWHPRYSDQQCRRRPLAAADRDHGGRSARHDRGAVSCGLQPNPCLPAKDARAKERRHRLHHLTRLLCRLAECGCLHRRTRRPPRLYRGAPRRRERLRADRDPGRARGGRQPLLGAQSRQPRARPCRKPDARADALDGRRRPRRSSRALPAASRRW